MIEEQKKHTWIELNLKNGLYQQIGWALGERRLLTLKACLV